MTGELESAAIRTAASLALVVGLIICLFYLFRRWRFGALTPNNQVVMRLIGTLSLAPRRSLALVEIDDQWLVVGVGTDRVTFIAKIKRPPEAERHVPPNQAGGIRGRWQRKLKAAGGRENESAQ